VLDIVWSMPFAQSDHAASGGSRGVLMAAPTCSNDLLPAVLSQLLLETTLPALTF
jgi:hypothetical protein